MKCTSCKNEISEGAKFCKFCGTPVSAASKDTVTTEKICSNCNQSVSATAKFCKFCGERIDADSSIDNNESNNSTIRNNNKRNAFPFIYLYFWDKTKVNPIEPDTSKKLFE